MRKTLAKIIYLILIAVVSGCGARESNSSTARISEDGGELTISAAISLKDAFDELGKAFQATTGRRLILNYASSGALERQIENGAPVDVFASAGGKQMDQLAEKGFVEVSTRRDFALNSIVLIVPKDSKLKISSLRDLGGPEVKRVAIGNPKTVPAGQYAEESLINLGLRDALAPKIIFAENVRQVLNYVARGEVDAGIVYATDARAAKDEIMEVGAADDSSHTPILYPIAVVKDSKNEASARAFVDFVLSTEGQKILQKFGFRSAVKK